MPLKPTMYRIGLHRPSSAADLLAKPSVSPVTLGKYFTAPFFSKMRILLVPAS